MQYSQNVINVLAAKSFKGIGRAWIVKNLKGNETSAVIVSLLNQTSKQMCQITLHDFENAQNWIIQKINQLQESIDGAVALGDPYFPSYRGQVKGSEQPIVLFYKGDLSLLQASNKNTAVIGLLDPDQSTEIIENQLVAALVNNGATIVSGLAKGCDAIAHKQTLRSGGKTIAILPSPLNSILPTSNIYLANEIVENGGLLITEYFESPKSRMELSGRYQERDRLQALFSDNIVLSASYAKNEMGNDSGSRLAMEYALNYGIPRAVIYQPELDQYNPKYDLNRQIINQQQDNVMVINATNYKDLAKKLVLNVPKPHQKDSMQASLF